MAYTPTHQRPRRPHGNDCMLHILPFGRLRGWAKMHLKNSSCVNVAGRSRTCAKQCYVLVGSPGAEFQVNDLGVKLGMAVAGLLSRICTSRKSAMNSRNPYPGVFVIKSRTPGKARRTRQHAHQNANYDKWEQLVPTSQSNL